jgi:DNA-binding helix-hairpin-helix protein with protein kinase domain
MVLIHSFLNLNPMVQADISQLTGECNTWREALRQYRDEFTQDKSRLQQVASQPLSKDQLQEVEHLHNQFHIQLINIHDLKQAIKVHDRKLSFEVSANSGQVNEETVTSHEGLFDQYQTLDHTC